MVMNRQVESEITTVTPYLSLGELGATWRLGGSCREKKGS